MPSGCTGIRERRLGRYVFVGAFMAEMTDLSALQPLGGYQLPPNYYYSEAWFQREQQDLFARTWRFACFERDLAQPGDYRPVQVGNEPLLITRAADGKLHALHNVCRHRGIKLYEQCGNARALSCPYHAWRYTLQGELDHVPQHASQFPQLKLEDWGLLKGSVDRWAGMVFVHPDPDAPPLAAWLGGLGERLKRFDSAGLEEVHAQQYDMAANWKFYIENHIDWLHLYFLHARSLKDYQHSGGELSQHGPHWTSFERPKPGREGVTHDRRTGLLPLEGLTDADADVGAHLIFPNLALITSPYFLISLHVQPVSAESCTVEFRVQARPDDTAREVHAHEFEQVMEEDRFAAEALQAAVRSRAFSVGPMALEWEAPLAHFHEHYRRTMSIDSARPIDPTT